MKLPSMQSILASLWMLPQWVLRGSPLKADEDLVFFPVAAKALDHTTWQADLHGWVFEREENSIWRKVATYSASELMECLGVDEAQAHDDLFKQRFSWFLVDNERNKRIVARVAEQRVVSHRSDPNGHFSFPAVKLGGAPGSWLPVAVEAVTEAQREIRGEVQLVKEQGVTVISDIDDTVKISDVLDRKALVRNTFTAVYKPTKGMPELYRALHEQGAYFHYLSSSPWQLQRELQSFLLQYFPKGTMSLRHFRLGDQSFWDFFHSSMDYKLNSLRARIQAFPQHQFILIGDSGEKDAEVYAQIYSEFPNKIQTILIREVPNSDMSEARWQAVFAEVPADRWHLLPVEVNADEALALLDLNVSDNIR